MISAIDVAKSELEELFVLALECATGIVSDKDTAFKMLTGRYNKSMERITEAARKEHLMICLMEEASEVVKATAKAIRFGIDNRYPDEQAKSNRESMVDEINDVWTIVGMLSESDVPLSGLMNGEHRRVKSSKVEKWLPKVVTKWLPKAVTPASEEVRDSR